MFKWNMILWLKWIVLHSLHSRYSDTVEGRRRRRECLQNTVAPDFLIYQILCWFQNTGSCDLARSQPYASYLVFKRRKSLNFNKRKKFVWCRIFHSMDIDQRKFKKSLNVSLFVLNFLNNRVLCSFYIIMVLPFCVC